MFKEVLNFNQSYIYLYVAQKFSNDIDNAYHVQMIYVIFTEMSLETCYGPNLVRQHVLEILLFLKKLKTTINRNWTKFVFMNRDSTHDSIYTRLSSYLEASYTLLKIT